MIRVVIADDHELIREGVKNLLLGETDIAVVGEVARSDEVLRAAEKTGADVLILDLHMPGRPGFELLKDIRSLKPELRVLVLTMHPEDSLAVRVLRAGASGYLTKESASEELLRAIRRVAGGGRYISSTLAERLAAALDQTSGKQPHELLSDREYQVFILLAGGKVVPEIAQSLALSSSTISTYRSRILEKMGMSTNAELMHYAISNNLTRPAK